MPDPHIQHLQSRRAMGFVLMSAVLPGSVQVMAGHRRLGRLAGRLFAGAMGVLVIVVLGLFVARGFTLGLLMRPVVLTVASIVTWVLFAVWALLLIDAWRLGRPLRLDRGRRLGLTALALTVLVGVAAGTALVTSTFKAASNVASVLRGGGDHVPKAGRYNILLLGADSAADREGLRPDSINVASIDAETGRTILFGLPRNLEKVRFPEGSGLRTLYPDGYVCEDSGCMLNGIYTLAMDHPNLYPGQDAGLVAMREAVSETLGLEINYYALIDMSGFESLVDAMGGVRLNIGKDIPIGGGSSRISGYIKAGENVLLDGYHALWFARSRAESSDYERMVRQKCVMAAMAAQLDPQTVATQFLKLSEAGRDIISTNVGPEAISDLTDLALKARSLPMETVNFSPPLIESGNPDFQLIRDTVTSSISQSEALDELNPVSGSSAPEVSTSPTLPKPTAPSAPSSLESPTQSSTSAEESGEPVEEGEEAQIPVCTIA